MLLILIPIVWLAVLTLFVAICLAAARGDAAQRRVEQDVVEDGAAAPGRDAAPLRPSRRSPAHVRHPALLAGARAVRSFHFASRRPQAGRPRLAGLPRRPA
jgi:hypothetical protein